MACDPNVIISDAKCIESCIPAGLLPAIQVSLLCQIASEVASIGSNPLAVYTSGLEYNLTAVMSPVTFGGTSPILTITAPGTYMVISNVVHDINGSASGGVAGTQFTWKLRRTNR